MAKLTIGQEVAIKQVRLTLRLLEEALENAYRDHLHGALVCVLHHAPEGETLPIAVMAGGAHTNWGPVTVQEIGRALAPILNHDQTLLAALLAGIAAGVAEEEVNVVRVERKGGGVHA